MSAQSPVSLLALIAALAASPVLAQDQSAAAPPAEEDLRSQPNEILVVAERIRGQVDAPQPPVAVYDETAVAALGASSINDVLAAIAPQTGSGRGRGGGGHPAMLVNGQRITNFREMRNFPPEAIRRIEVLPEEVGLRYGFPPDTRVVNLILKDDFSSKRIEAEFAVPTRGNWSSGELEATAMKLKGPQRFSLTLTADRASPLTEAERPLVQSIVRTVPSDPDPAANRTLIAGTRNLGVNLTWSRGLGNGGTGGQISANAAFARATSNGYSGLDTVQLNGPGGASALRTLPDPLQRRSRTSTAEGGAGINTFLGMWQLAATLDATHAEGTSWIDRRADTAALVTAAAVGTLAVTGPLPALSPAGQDLTRTNSDRIDTLITLTGRPLRLPAGQVNLTVKGGYTWLSYDSMDQRAGGTTTALLRKRLIGGFNLALPLTSRRERVLQQVGDLALNFSADWTDLSDFGGTSSWSAGLTWAPLEGLGLQASYIVNQSAPAISQLGNPQTQTFNVPLFDFTRGVTSLVTVIGGGNPLLRKERQRDLKLAGNWDLPFMAGSNLVVEYFRNRSNDVTASFPLLTPEIEAAFAGRVVRDAAGRIVSVDQRPVTLTRQDGSRLRWGLNLSGKLGKPDPAAARGGGMMGGGAGAPAPRGMGRGPGGGGGPVGMMGRMMGGGDGQGRWSLGLFHTAQFTSTVLVAPGGPVLDLLNGDALTNGGTPRHSVDLNGGAFYKGFGMFMNGTWAAPTRVRSGTSDLRFGSVTKLNINLFSDLSQRFKQSKLMKGIRVSVRVENVFDSRQKVTDAAGTVPLSYQPDYLDPRGRVVELELRKMF